VDAIVKIDSLVNGAKVNKIDDNSNGTGYKDAFQPAVQSGNMIGMSYVVFAIDFYEHNTMNPVSIPVFNATTLDLDGNSTLKEFSRVKVGNGSIMNYLMTNPDISVLQLLPGDYLGQNVLGIERNGIDTSYINAMYTVSNTNISSFSVRFGTLTTVPSTANRQFSLYLKGFTYPGSSLPVKFSSFTAALNGSKKVDLKWTTSAEMNVSHFVVERSTDGVNFSDAGVVFAMGNSSTDMHYAFPDNIAGIDQPVIYYRLRCVDVDGFTEYSGTRMIRLVSKPENQITIMTYPNPVSNELRITVPSAWQNKKVVYELFTANGQTIKRLERGNSTQTETLNTSQLSKGLYIIRVSCNGETAQQKIIKH